MSCAAVVVACSSDADETTSGNDTGASTVKDAGTSTDGSSAADAEADADIQTVSGDSGVRGYTVGGTVTGLTGTGLILRNNGGDDLAITGAGTFTFPSALVDATGYEVTVFADPKTPTQHCEVTDGKGTLAGASAANVVVTCTTTTFTVGGTVTGLVGTGLVLTNNGAGDVGPDENEAYTFGPIASGSKYEIAVKTQPDMAQTCTIADGTASGTVGAANVSVAIVCTSLICGDSNGENQDMVLTCPTGQVIASIDFASYGTAPADGTGDTCGTLAVGTCDAATTTDIVKAACVGNATCTINASNDVFQDPCSGTGKKLRAQATCKQAPPPAH